MKSDKQLPEESRTMRICCALGLKRLRWSLRRLHCPVSGSALVLEVGAGGNPYPRANVCLDAEEQSVERNEQELPTDRPLVLGLAEELPFKDKSFDFIIASHILEHTDNPQKFLNELMRVGKAGYIETPEGWFEKMCAFTYHRLEVSNENGKLIINKKENWRPDPIAHLYEIKLAKSKPLAKFLRVNPDLNHLRFFWQDHIDFEILNNDVDASWDYPVELLDGETPPTQSILAGIRGVYLTLRRWLFSQNRRNRKLDISAIIRCPSCHSENLSFTTDQLTCDQCSCEYSVIGGSFNLFPKNTEGFNRQRVNLK